MKDLRLETTFAVGLLTVRDNNIIETPPIFKWMRGKDLQYVMNYLKRKGQFVSLIEI